MQIIRNFQNINCELQNTVLTIGNFDGIHLGHQQILNNIKEIANKANLKSALLTFEPHPIKIINPKQHLDIRITSLSQKLHFLREKKLVDIFFVNSFDQKLANLSAEDFVGDVLVAKLKIKHLVIGYDFIFGKNRSGDANLLEKLAKKYGFAFDIIPAQKDPAGQIYSSTLIRQLLDGGNVLAAHQILGRPYQVSGLVIKGKQLARSIGFPTLNLLPRAHIIKPKLGVYKSRVIIDNKPYQSIVNFGIKPTFNLDEPLFEAHIFNFNQEIYGKKVVIELLDFIRDEKKFSGINELQAQIKKDCALAQIY